MSAEAHNASSNTVQHVFSRQQYVRFFAKENESYRKNKYPKSRLNANNIAPYIYIYMYKLFNQNVMLGKPS